MNIQVIQAAERIAHGLRSHIVSKDEIARAMLSLPAGLMPYWYIELLQTIPIAGSLLRISRPPRAYTLEWLDASGIVEEAEHYPGIIAVQHGYLPVAGCSTGSGDPYFFAPGGIADNPRVVQIYHDACGIFPSPDSMEIVSERLSDLFEEATLDA